MDGVEIIQAMIPLNCYERKSAELINTLLQIDEILFNGKTDPNPKEVA